MRDVNSLAKNVFSGLSALVVEDVTDEGEAIRLSARTRHKAAECPKCGSVVSRPGRMSDPDVDSSGLVRDLVLRLPVGALHYGPHMGAGAELGAGGDRLMDRHRGCCSSRSGAAADVGFAVRDCQWGALRSCCEFLP